MTVLLPLLLPALAAVVALSLRGRPTAALRAATLLLGLTVLGALAAAAAGGGVSWTWGSGLELHLRAEGFARVMAVLVPLIAAPVMAYIDSGEGPADAGRTRLVVSICGFVAAMELLVLAGDLLTLLIGWELVGALSWALIGFEWREEERPRSAAIAFLTTRFGDLGLYLAAAAALAGAGSLEFEALSTLDGIYLHVVLAGILVAAAAKSAQLPFSPWLYAAMAGPTPVSALLHSATLVAAGAFLLIRLGPLGADVGWFGPTVAGLGATTLVAGGLAACVQTDAKRVLAASTCSQYGLMFLAVGLGATAAAGAHLVAHAFFKSLLFLGAGVAIHAAGTRELAGMRLGAALPTTAVPFAIGALSLAAVPLTGGGVTKELIVASALETSPPLGWMILASGLVTGAYAFRLTVLAFGPGSRRDVRRPGPGELVSLGLLAFLSLAMAALQLPVAHGVRLRLLGSAPEAAAWELVVSLLVLLVAAGSIAALQRRGALVSLALPSRTQRVVGEWFGLGSLARLALVRPVLTVGRRLALIDDRVVDAGVRAAAAAGRALSKILGGFGERAADGLVAGATALTTGLAFSSRKADDHVVDGVVEGIAETTWAGGSRSRRLQSGMTHHYYVIAGVGLLAMLGVSVLWR